MTARDRDIPEAQRVPHLTARGLGQVTEDTARDYHTTPGDIVSSTRSRSTSRARACLCWRLMHEHALSSVEIGRFLGIDQGSVLNAVRTHWERIRSGDAPLPEGITIERAAE